MFKAGKRPNTLAWNNEIGRAVLFCWFLESPFRYGRSFSINLRMIEDEIIFSVNLTQDSINKLTAFIKMIMVIITLNTSNYQIINNTI